MFRQLFIPIAAILFALPAQAAPPREESPAPQENLKAFGAGSSDDEMARAIAAANAYPLGTLANPIRVAGPEGARAYLARLRCTDGVQPRVSGERAGEIGPYGTLTRLFTVTCGSAAPVSLTFDLYQEEHVETRSPPGFRPAS